MISIKPKENRKPNTSKIDVRKSKVHGSGVFAACDIKKGEKVIEYVGRIVTKDEAEDIADEQLEKSNGHKDCGGVYIFELNKKYDIDGNVSWNPARFINHSCDPNCETEGDDERIWVIALKAIKKGEELSYDYCYDIDNWDEHPCKCGAKSCVGYIVAEKLRGKIKRNVKKV